jgi:hypothetical protein
MGLSERNTFLNQVVGEIGSLEYLSWGMIKCKGGSYQHEWIQGSLHFLGVYGQGASQ